MFFQDQFNSILYATFILISSIYLYMILTCDKLLNFALLTRYLTCLLIDTCAQQVIIMIIVIIIIIIIIIIIVIYC